MKRNMSGVKFRAGGLPRVNRLLRQSQCFGCSPSCVRKADPGQGIFALHPEHPVLVGINRQHHSPGLCGNDIFQFSMRGGVDWRFDNLEILRAISIGQNQKPVALMVNTIFKPFIAGA